MTNRTGKQSKSKPKISSGPASFFNQSKLKLKSTLAKEASKPPPSGPPVAPLGWMFCWRDKFPCGGRDCASSNVSSGARPLFTL